MSLETWIKEFYPTPAGENVDTALQAAKHSLHKWRGTSKENLAKHGVITDKNRIIELNDNIHDDRYFEFDSFTCSLCEYVDSSCCECPLVESGHDRCMDYGAPYYSNDYETLVTHLEETVKWLEDNNVE